MLTEFVRLCHGFLDFHDENTAVVRITQLLAGYLAYPAFRSIIPDTEGRHTLYEAPQGLTILGHNHPESVWSRPHDHGTTWAIYGVAEGRTAMYDFDQVDDETVKLKSSYWIMPGQACCYHTRAIHAHKTFEVSKLIRIEGKNILRKTNNITSRYFTPLG